MSNDIRPFAPFYNQSQYVNGVLQQQGQCVGSVTVTAADATAVPSTAFPGSNNNGQLQIQIANKTSVWVHVNFGNLQAPNTVRAATINDMPVAPGTQIVVTVDPEVNAASVFANGAPAGATGVVFTRGSGVG